MPSPVIPFEPPYTPEMSEKAQHAIEALVSPGDTIFEYGSGHSTLWLAGLGADVISVEHDQEWHDAIIEELKQVELSASIILISESDIPHAIVGRGLFSMIIVDCLDSQRVNAIMAAKSHIKPGGYLVVDDSQWSILRGVPELLSGWEATTYSGQHTRKTGVTKQHETTIYKRPADV